MARKPTGKPNGRPPIEINWERFEDLCKVLCTSEEICNIMNVGSKETLNRHIKAHYDGETFEDVYKRLADPTKASLRRNQLRMSQTNPTMAIWCGKQILGQSDKTVNLQGNTDDVEFRNSFFGIKTKKKES